MWFHYSQIKKKISKVHTIFQWLLFREGDVNFEGYFTDVASKMNPPHSPFETQAIAQVQMLGNVWVGSGVIDDKILPILVIRWK